MLQLLIPSPFRDLRRDRRGSTAVLGAILMGPVVMIGGLALDCGRLIHYRTVLQETADAAALSGAVVFSTQDLSAVGNVRKAVDNVFAALPSSGDLGLEAGYPKVVTGQAFRSDGTIQKNSVTVTAKARVGLTILSYLLPTGQEISVTATAANPFPYVRVTLTGTPKSKSAGAWNSIYAYPVPMTGFSSDSDGAGYPNGGFLPAPPDVRNPLLREIMDDCAATGLAVACNPANGYPNTQGAYYSGVAQDILVSSSQPISFLMKSVAAYKDSLPPSSQQFTYGTRFGTVSIFMASSYLQGGAPTLSTSWYLDKSNSAASGLKQPDSQNVVYPTTQNCNLQVAVNDGTLTGPPKPGVCTDVQDAVSGYSISSPTCAQMNGRTLRYYWNDMGGAYSDDKDYNDIVYDVTCVRSSSSDPIGVTLTQ